MVERCQACLQPIPAPKRQPLRVCCDCGKPISSHHKYHYVATEHGYTALAHRHCDNPFSYEPKDGEGQ